MGIVVIETRPLSLRVKVHLLAVSQHHNTKLNTSQQKVQTIHFIYTICATHGLLSQCSIQLTFTVHILCLFHPVLLVWI